jgi:hypothetical protein
MDKTISQIAMEIGVSKQAVWQKIKKEPLSTKLKDSTKKIGNTLYVNTDGIELIKNSFFKINANNTSIDVNNHKENANKKSTDEIIDILTMQLKIINQQNENLAKELSKEREHSRELADKLAEIAYTAQKLHGGDMVSRLSNNEIEINSEEKTKKRSGMFNGIFNRILKKGQNT